MRSGQISTKAPTVTYEEANRVASKLAVRLRGIQGLRGIGVAPDPAEGFSVTVRIAHNASVPKLADRIDGVAVHLERREMAHALRP